MSPLKQTALSLCLALLAVPALFAGAKPREFAPPRSLSDEAKTFVNLLEQAHYNRDAVKVSSYDEIIQEYMAALDGQRLYFVQADKDAFRGRYPSEFIYWNLAGLGRIDAAYRIFQAYEKSVRDRAAWIDKRLSQPLDLDGDDTYEFDRSKAPWAKDAEELDALWLKRLKLEVIKELLGKKTPEDAVAKVRKRYDRHVKNLAELETVDIAEIFLRQIAHLYDPHSDYLSAETFEEFGIGIRLQLVGIGAQLSMEDDLCVIKEIIPGGPADLDKRLKPNDKIIAVAQEGKEPVDVIGMQLRKVVRMIRGEKGTKVFLTVESGGANKVIDITRDVVSLDSQRAHAAVFQVPGAGGATLPLGVIRLPVFYGGAGADDGKENSTSRDVAELIRRLREKNVAGIVLDLRNNGGGLLNEAVALAGLFIPRGPVVQVRNSTGQVKVDSDENPDVAYDGPLVVLTSRFSASASEIAAGALQNYGRAIIIGDNATFGKGSVQAMLEMKNMSPQLAQSRDKLGATRLTIQKFYLPNGASTQLKGVIPDISLPNYNEFMPSIGEGSLPHVLPWDEIPTSVFDGRPLAPGVLAPLREAALRRVETLPEFDFLKRNVALFKKHQDEKTVSLNLEARRARKISDRDERNAFNLERKTLSDAFDYPFEEILLAAPREPVNKSAKNRGADDDEDEEDNYKELFPDENERYPRMDIPLRESFRVLVDILNAPAAPKPAGVASTGFINH